MNIFKKIKQWFKPKLTSDIPKAQWHCPEARKRAFYFKEYAKKAYWDGNLKTYRINFKLNGKWRNWRDKNQAKLYAKYALAKGVKHFEQENINN